MMRVLCIQSARVYSTQMAQAFSLFQEQFLQADIQVENLVLQEEVEGCHACGKCQKRRTCILEDDLNPLLKQISNLDAILIGYDLKYGYPNMSIQNFLKRLVHCASDRLSYLPVCTYTIAKDCEEKAFASIDALLEMMNATICTTYHHNVSQPDSINQEQIAQIAKRMIWLLKCMELGKLNGFEKPENHEILRDFMR